MDIRDKNDILIDIKKLVSSKGYIYAICLIIIDDFHFNVEQMHEVDYWSRLNKNEICLLLGFIIQDRISLERPNSAVDLIELKKRTYSLMDELHRAVSRPVFENLKSLNNPLVGQKLEKHEVFGGENLFIEPIFYSGDGVYDFQYLEYLGRKYIYDVEWLEENRHFRFDEVEKIVMKIKALHNDKMKRVQLFGLKDNKNTILKTLKKGVPSSQKLTNTDIEQLMDSVEFYQFNQLFDADEHKSQGFSIEEISEKAWSSFYNGLLDLFCFSSSDFECLSGFADFIYNFSTENSEGLNKQFRDIGDFNLISAKPIIHLDCDKYFVPVVFSVFEAVYECPYYWMSEDKRYLDKLASNRGNASESIMFELLRNVFGAQRVYKAVRIESKKGSIETDIDILCILGSKALCVQVKSKKLTQVSRKGSFEQLRRDFGAAVQMSFEQGLICRDRILDRSSKFYDENGSIIILSEEIDEVYILGVTTENYPSLTHQTSVLLEKRPESPHALFMTVFDLELVLFYLNNPYDFLYYVRQRIELMEYFNANEEIHYLGYHLTRKLLKDPKHDFIHIDSSLGQLIDRNYYPFKLGVETSETGDRIRSRWKNYDFEKLCSDLNDLNSPRITDIIFHLLDWSEDSREIFVNHIKKIRELTKQDGRWHNFSLMNSPERSSFGVTYISAGDTNVEELTTSLLALSRARKYRSKADHWIGFGCLKNSLRLVDIVVFNNLKWIFDDGLESEAVSLFDGDNKGASVSLGRKIGKNDLCSCGSQRKYKHCCGRPV